MSPPAVSNAVVKENNGIVSFSPVIHSSSMGHISSGPSVSVSGIIGAGAMGTGVVVSVRGAAPTVVW